MEHRERRRGALALLLAMVIAMTLLAVPAHAERDCVGDGVADRRTEVLDVLEVCFDHDVDAGTIGVEITTARPPQPSDIPTEPTELFTVVTGDRSGRSFLRLSLQRLADGSVIGGWRGIGDEPIECPAAVTFFATGLATVADLSCSPDSNGCAQVIELEPFGDRLLQGDAQVNLGDWSFGTIDAMGRNDEPDPVPDVDPSLVGAASVDGDPRTTERVGQNDLAFAAIVLSRQRFSGADGVRCTDIGPGYNPPRHVVVARNDQFADALAAGPLLADGPLLYSSTAEIGPVALRELQRLIGGGGDLVAYVLGGEQALSPRVAGQLTELGYTVQRLAGPSRVETAIAVAEVARPYEPLCREERGIVECEDQQVAHTAVGIARADAPADSPTAAWADAVTAGGAGLPVLLTPTAALHPAVAAFLEAEGVRETVLYGGTSALSDAVEAALPEPTRIAGAERAETAVAIANLQRGLFLHGERAVAVFNGFAEDGWAYGLAAAGLGLPLLMVDRDRVPPATAEALSSCGAPEVDVLVVGAPPVIEQSVIDQLDQLDGYAC